MRSGPGAARTILLSHIISARPSKQPLMVRTFLKVYMELGSYFLFLQEQIKDIIIISRAEPSLAGQWLPAAGGDGAWAARTGSGPMLMRGDIFAASRGGGAGC